MTALVATTELLVQHRLGSATVTALRHPGLRVEEGESVAVMGASGSGKSTLLGLVAGLAVPTRGEVRLAGTSLSTLDDLGRAGLRRRLVGMVYQADNLLPHLTAEENVALLLALTRPAAGRRARRPAGPAGPGRPAQPHPRPAVRRPATAGRGGPRGRRRTAARPGGRTDRRLDEQNARGVVELLVGVRADSAPRWSWSPMTPTSLDTAAAWSPSSRPPAPARTAIMTRLPGAAASARYVVVDLLRNPRRTLTTLVGVALGVALFCGVLFLIDGLGLHDPASGGPRGDRHAAVVTQRAGAHLRLDQSVPAGPLTSAARSRSP
ncbi:MAG: ATP-binding cassette domain-containing protein [Nocardioides sp.]